MKNITRKLRLSATAAGVAAALTLSMAACSDDESTTNSDGSVNLSAVTLKVGDQAGIQQAIVEASGALDGAEYKVEWAQFPAAAPLLEAEKAGAIDIGYTGDAPLINALAAGADISLVSVMENDGANGLAVIVPEDSSIKSVADLKGKTVSPTTQGSIGHYELLSALKEEGLTADDVTISFLEPVNAAAALKSGSIDAWATWDPYTAAVEIDDNARVIRDAEGISSKLGILSANNDALADPATKAAMIDFIGRFNTALQWANDNEPEYIAIYSKLTKRPENIAALVAKRSQRVATALDAEQVAKLQTVADNYLQFGVLKNQVVIADNVQDLAAAPAATG